MGSSRLHSGESPQNIHVFMVSFPGQGHVNPLLRLAKRLAGFGLFVTLAAPESAGVTIRKSSDGEPVRSGRGEIRFEFFDDGWDPTRPKSSNDLDAYVAQLELVGREKLPLMIRNHQETGRPVSCLINNPFIPWVTDVAESLGIPSAMLWVQSCASFSAYYHYCHNLVPFPSEEEPEIDVQLPFLPLLKHDEVPSFLHPSTDYPFLGRVILGQFKNLSKTFCVLMDTFEELEREIICHVSEVCGRPVRTIGPLFKELGGFSGDGEIIRADFFTAEDGVVGWLDTKAAATVVYVSFGSVVSLEQEQVEEIAYGLLGSGVSFLWVLRPPAKESESAAAARVLPVGFLEGLGDRGRVVTWAPQEEVLAHPSTACFVTHCGWNSTVEALAGGVPVVAFPQWGDQVTDAKFLVDVFKVGVRMCRGAAEGRIVRRDEVEKCLRAATAGPEAAEMKANALRWKKAAEEAVAEGGSSYRNMQDFVDEVVQIVRSD
ncbi:hypothetical protein ABFS82_02G039100 [Erythranthe guttata]|nr:PREDICTED: limonoid UDP-glucosyltransferase-like [Erythranthe guttata]|eukprot:XP_012836899.1 PREDICTED: limonoid UDP-glucosyltransferase-like [Erythranthe guttata]